SHVDCYPAIVEAVGVGFAQVRDDHPGVSLFDIAGGAAPPRALFSEYHGMGSTTGAFALRSGRHKYVHYVKYPPQLFDLESDPEELDDLAARPEFASMIGEFRQKLQAICDPDEIDRR